MTIDPSDVPNHNISQMIAEAARDLANRIGLGEFDDLDEGALNDLRGLSEMMDHWARVTHALEQQRKPVRSTLPSQRNIRPPAFRN